MRVLIVTNLFPNSREPGRGVFNRQQVAELARGHRVTVIAPVPWVPLGFGRLAAGRRFASVPRRETIDGLEVWHPRYLAIPGIGRPLHGVGYFLGIRRTVNAIHRRTPIDVVLATWAYPDVFGAVLAARRIGRPVVAKVHGSDIHLALRLGWRRRAIRWALSHCAAVIAVSESLKQALLALGLEAQRIVVVPNGVDRARFAPMERHAAREALRLRPQGRRIVFVGHLTAVKGLQTLIDAMLQVPGDVRLTLVGEGELAEPLRASAASRGLNGRVEFVGRRPHEEIPLWLNAADVCCLPSLSEGCPNAAVEALACGRPVIASRVGGVPDVVREPACGILVPAGQPQALAQALTAALARPWDAGTIRASIEAWGWAENVERLEAVLQAAAAGAA